MLIPRTDSHVWNCGTGLCTFPICFLASGAVLMKFIVSLLALNTFAALIKRAHSTWPAYIRQFRNYELILLYCHPCTISLVLCVSLSVFLLNINSFSLSLKSTVGFILCISVQSGRVINLTWWRLGLLLCWVTHNTLDVFSLM